MDRAHFSLADLTAAWAEALKEIRMGDIQITNFVVSDPKIRDPQAETCPRFEIFWTWRGKGFGSFTFARQSNGRLYVENEYMSREDIKAVLCALVDQCELEDGE